MGVNKPKIVKLGKDKIVSAESSRQENYEIKMLLCLKLSEKSRQTEETVEITKRLC